MGAATTTNNMCPRPRCGGRSILVIEDEDELRCLLSHILAAEGYQVQTVRTARHALHVMRHHSFDVVLSDISLPDVDGIELIRQIASEFPHVSVIAMSGFMAAISPARLCFAGAAVLLQKPFPASQLLRSVSELHHRKSASVARA